MKHTDNPFEIERPVTGGHPPVEAEGPAGKRSLLPAFLLVFVLGALAALGVVAVARNHASATLVVKTTPERASVEVNGNFRGTTPLTLTDVPPGDYVLRITRFGFQPTLSRVTVKAGENEAAWDLEAVPGGSIEIVTRPAGAEVYVDGEARGETPLVLPDVAAGEHEIRLSKVNYVDRIERVDVARDARAKLDIALLSRTEDFYIKKIAAEPRAAEPRTDLAHYHILQHEWKKAEDRYREALVLIVLESGSRAYAGRLYTELDKVATSQFDYGDADAIRKGREVVVNALVGAVKETPRHVENYHQALKFCQQFDVTGKAQEIVETGIVTFPYETNWYRQSMRGYGRRDGGERSLAQIEARIKANPDDFFSHFQRMDYMRNDNRIDEMARELDELARLAKDPRAKSRLLNDQGAALQRLKKFDEAVAVYGRAIEIEPDPKMQASLQYNLVRALEQAGQKDKLPDAWQRAVELQEDPEIANSWRLEYARACIALGQNERARKLLADVANQTKSDKTRQDADALIGQLK